MLALLKLPRRVRRVGLSIGLAGALAALPVIATAQATDVPGVDQALVEAARAEGVLTLYSTQDEKISQDTVRAFEQAFPGITVRLLRLASVQLYSRLSSEVEAGIFEVDVFGSGDTRAFTQNPDWWAPMTTELVPTISLLPENNRKDNFVVMAQGAAMMAYNPTLVDEKDVPKHWTDVLNPAFKDNCLIVDPRNSTVYISWVAQMVDLYGEDFIRKVHEQNCQLVSAGSPGAQEVGAGGAAIVFPVTRSHIIPVIKSGAPLVGVEPWRFSEIAALGSETSFGIAARAPHPNVARLYLSWLLTPDAQKVNCGGAYASYTLSREQAEEAGCPAFAERFQPLYDLTEERRNYLLSLLGL